MKSRFRKVVWLSVVPLLFLITAATAHIDFESFRDVITYYDPERPPIIEWYRKNDDKRWELIAVNFDSDGDWALDAGISFIGGDQVREREFFPHMKNKQRLYAKVDSAEAFEKDKTFRLDLIAVKRLFRRPAPEALINPQRRTSKEYQGLLKRLAAVKLAPRPHP